MEWFDMVRVAMSPAVSGADRARLWTCHKAASAREAETPVQADMLKARASLKALSSPIDRGIILGEEVDSVRDLALTSILNRCPEGQARTLETQPLAGWWSTFRSNALLPKTQPQVVG